MIKKRKMPLKCLKKKTLHQPVGFVPVAVGKSAEDLVPRGMFRKIHLDIYFIIRHTLL